MSVYHNKSWSAVERWVNQVKKFKPFCILGTCNGSLTMTETPADGFDFNEEPVKPLQGCSSLLSDGLRQALPHPHYGDLSHLNSRELNKVIIRGSMQKVCRSRASWSTRAHLMWYACVSLTLQWKWAAAARCERPCWCSLQGEKSFFPLPSGGLDDAKTWQKMTHFCEDFWAVS